MVWGVSFVFLRVRLEKIPIGLQWAVACLFILVVGMSMAELASAAPTSGGVSNGGLAGQNVKNIVMLNQITNSFIFGLTLIHPLNGAISLPGSSVVCRFCIINYKWSHSCLVDANTIGNIASVASVDWSASVQVMAAASIGSNGSFTATKPKTLLVL